MSWAACPFPTLVESIRVKADDLKEKAVDLTAAGFEPCHSDSRKEASRCFASRVANFNIVNVAAQQHHVHGFVVILNLCGVDLKTIAPYGVEVMGFWIWGGQLVGIYVHGFVVILNLCGVDFKTIGP